MYCISVFAAAIRGKSRRNIIGNESLLSAALGKVACSGSTWQLAVAVLPSVALGKELKEPAAVKSLYFVERHRLSLGKYFAECPLWLSANSYFAERCTPGDLCEGFLALCRVFLALGVRGVSNSDLVIQRCTCDSKIQRLVSTSLLL